jgi:heterodisulfide reductase subunit C
MEVCPQGVKPFEVGLAIRRWQCRKDETYIPPSLPELFETGYTQPVHKVGALRKSVGLEEPPSVVNDPESMERFHRMLKETEIIKSAPYMFGE